MSRSLRELKMLAVLREKKTKSLLVDHELVSLRDDFIAQNEHF